MGLVDGKTMQDSEETSAEGTGFPADTLNDFMVGEDIFLGFSSGTIGVVIGLITSLYSVELSLGDSYSRKLWT